MTLGTYDPKQVATVFSGHLITGFAPGTFVNVEYNEDSFSLSVGAAGDACRAKSNNRSARVTVTLMQSSLSNTILSGFHNADVNSPAGDGVAPMLVKDASGTSLHSAENAWIVKPAPSEFAQEPSTREWVFETDVMISNVGGN